MNRIIKILKTIFETFSLIHIDYDLDYGFSIGLLEFMLTNKKATNIDNITIERSLFRITINNKRIYYGFFFMKLKTYYYE